MSRPNPDLRPRLYGGDLEPQGHAAAYIIVLFVFGLVGLVVATAQGWVSVPGPLVLGERSRTAPLLVLPTATPLPPAPTAVPTTSPALLAAEDWDIPDGHFFTQSNGQPHGTSAQGYAVTNADGIPFWDTLRELGGVERLGYPLSGRFSWKGLTTQVFQKAVLQWRSDTRRVEYLNLLDEMSAVGKDEWLLSQKSVPRPLDPAFDQGKDWDARVRARQALLDANPSFRAAYFAVPDPLRLYGLPASQVTDMGNHYALRLQRAVFRQWKVDMSGARRGDVTVEDVGAIAVEAGLFPQEALKPADAPTGSAPLNTGVAAPANPTVQPTAPSSLLQVANTGGAGVYLRRTPRMDDKLLAWPEKARMEDLGEQTQADNVLWRKVKDPAGNVGWIPAQYLVAAQ